jgi:hypothetical protein
MHISRARGGSLALGFKNTAKKHRVHFSHIVAPKNEIVRGFKILITAHRLVALELRHESHHGAGHAQPGIGIDMIGSHTGLHPLQGRIAVEHGPLTRSIHGHRLRAAVP